MESVRQCQRDLHGAVGVVALAHVQNTGDAADLAQVKVVEAELAAGQRQHQGVHGRALDELRVVVAPGVSPVAAAHQKDVLHRAAPDGLDDLGRLVQYGGVGKPGGQHVAAVDAAHALVGLIAAQRLRLPDQRREILAALGVRGDVPQPVIAHHRRGVDPVGIAGPGRHQAVGGEQHRRGDIGKFLLLILPRRAEISRQMGVLLQAGIAVGGQHLAVGVDVDAPARRLLQKLVQVLQIVAGDHDERPLLHVDVHPGGDGIAEGLRVGPVQQGHALEVHLPELHDQRQPLLHAVLPGQRGQTLVEPGVHLLVPIAQVHGVVGVGRHSLQAEQQRGAQGDGVRLSLPEPRGVAAAAAAAMPPQSLVHPVGKGADGRVVEIHVGQRGEQPVGQQPRDLGGILLPLPADLRQPDQAAHQRVLQMGGLRLLAADARLYAAAAARRLLALKAKHF